MEIAQKKGFKERGFTLIELLIVIAIIGILSTLGMISLNSARQKGYDAQIKGDISNIRTSLAMCFDNNNGSYVGCTVPDNFVVPSCSEDYGVSPKYNLKTSQDAYVIWAGMCAKSNTDFCADSSGFVGMVTPSLPPSSASCQP